MKQDLDPYGLPDPRYDAARGFWERESYRRINGCEMPEWNDPEEQERRRANIYHVVMKARGRKIWVLTQEQIDSIKERADFFTAEQDLRKQADELKRRARDRKRIQPIAG